MSEQDQLDQAVELDAQCHFAWCGKLLTGLTYQVLGSCQNCKSVVRGTFTKGHEARNGVLGPGCPVCDCRRLYWKDLG